jgi:hypothetical protein
MVVIAMVAIAAVMIMVVAPIAVVVVLCFFVATSLALVLLMAIVLVTPPVLAPALALVRVVPRRVHLVIPTIRYEIDRPAAGVVFVAVLRPMPLVTRRYV